jgi:hypothetical protein
LAATAASKQRNHHHSTVADEGGSQGLLRAPRLTGTVQEATEVRQLLNKVQVQQQNAVRIIKEAVCATEQAVVAAMEMQAMRHAVDNDGLLKLVKIFKSSTLIFSRQHVMFMGLFVCLFVWFVLLNVLLNDVGNCGW